MEYVFYQQCRPMKRRKSIAQWLVRVSVYRSNSLVEEPSAAIWWIPSNSSCNNLFFGFHISPWPRSDCPWCMFMGCWVTPTGQPLVYTDRSITVCEWSHVRVPASLFLTCCGDLAQSVFQVRSTVSGRVHFGAALSGSQPGMQGVCGAQGEKKNSVEHTSASLRDAARY